VTIHDDVEVGRLGAVKAYLKKGGDLEARTTLDRTLLHIAAEKAQTAIGKLLIASGADPNAADYRKFTPLHDAAGIGCVELVEALLEAGAKADAVNAFKSTPLHAIAHGGGTAKANDRVAIVERLLDAGAKLEAKDSSGRTPLHFAAATGTLAQPPAIMKARLAVLKLLLDKGANPLRASPRETALDAARGLHQPKKYRIVWPEAVKLLENATLAGASKVGRRARKKR
jgi:ankyrin repeat protein